MERSMEWTSFFLVRSILNTSWSFCANFFSRDSRGLPVETIELALPRRTHSVVASGMEMEAQGRAWRIEDLGVTTLISRWSTSRRSSQGNESQFGKLLWSSRLERYKYSTSTELLLLVPNGCRLHATLVHVQLRSTGTKSQKNPRYKLRLIPPGKRLGGPRNWFQRVRRVCRLTCRRLGCNPLGLPVLFALGVAVTSMIQKRCHAVPRDATRGIAWSLAAPSCFTVYCNCKEKQKR